MKNKITCESMYADSEVIDAESDTADVLEETASNLRRKRRWFGDLKREREQTWLYRKRKRRERTRR